MIWVSFGPERNPQQMRLREWSVTKKSFVFPKLELKENDSLRHKQELIDTPK